MQLRQCGYRAARHGARGRSSASSSLLFARSVAATPPSWRAAPPGRHPRTVIGDLRHVRADHPHVSSAQHNHSHHNLAHPLVTHLCPGRCILQPQAPQPRGVRNFGEAAAPPSRQGPRRQRRRAQAPASRSLGDHHARTARPRPRVKSALTAHDGGERASCSARRLQTRWSKLSFEIQSVRGRTDETRHRAHRCSRRREARMNGGGVPVPACPSRPGVQLRRERARSRSVADCARQPARHPCHQLRRCDQALAAPPQQRPPNLLCARETRRSSELLDDGGGSSLRDVSLERASAI